MEMLKKGRRTYGALVELKSAKVLVVFRSPGDLSLDPKRGRGRSMAQAFTDGDAAWGVDDETLLKARRRGVTLVAVLVKKLNWLFMAPLEVFQDPKCYSRRNGTEHRYVPVSHFQTKNRNLSLGPTSR